MKLFKSSGLRVPDLVTVIVEAQRDGRLKPFFVGDGTMPRDSRAYDDMDALVSAVDGDVIALYRPQLNERAMGFQYAWYPWGNDQKALKIDGGPKAYLMFEIRQSADGYQAWLLTDPGLSIHTARLAELPDAMASTAVAHWPAIAGHAIPGFFHWNRELVNGAFRDVDTPVGDSR